MQQTKIRITNIQWKHPTMSTRISCLVQGRHVLICRLTNRYLLRCQVVDDDDDVSSDSALSDSEFASDSSDGDRDRDEGDDWRSHSAASRDSVARTQAAVSATSPSCTRPEQLYRLGTCLL